MTGRLKFRIAVVSASVAILLSLVVAPGLFAGERTDSHYDAEIAALEAALDQTTDAEMRASLQEKLAMARESRNVEIEARRNPVNSATQTALAEQFQREIEEDEARITPVFPGRTPAGAGYIVRDAQPGLAKDLVSSSSHWLSDNGDGSTLYAFAGADRSDEAQGKLVVMTVGASEGTIEGQFPTPARNGRVNVVGADGRVLELEAEDGTHFYFDLETLAYK